MLAISRYVRLTEDRGILANPAVAQAVRQLPALVEPWRHPDCELYGTFLLPTDDPTDFPYVTTANALLAAALDAAADLTEISPADLGLRSGELRERAGAIREALRARLMTDGPHGPMWAWACDADGRLDSGRAPARTAVTAVLGHAGGQRGRAGRHQALAPGRL